MLSFNVFCRVFQARGAAHIKALAPKTVLALLIITCLYYVAAQLILD